MSVPEYLRVIRLGYGKGEPGKQACWMTALQSHLGGEWTDECACVDPVINQLCIAINDAYEVSDDARTRDILEFGLFRPIGTAGDRDATQRRMWHILDAATRRIVPAALEQRGCEEFATALRKLKPVADSSQAFKVATMIDDFSLSCRNSLYEARLACSDIVRPLRFVKTFSVATVAGFAAISVINACTAMGLRDALKAHAYPLLAELIEMGPHGPSEIPPPANGIEGFHQLVGAK